MSVSIAQRTELAKRAVSEIQKRLPRQIALSRGVRGRRQGLRGDIYGFQFSLVTPPVVGTSDASIEVTIGDSKRHTTYVVTEHNQLAVVKQVLAFLAEQYVEYINQAMTMIEPFNNAEDY